MVSGDLVKTWNRIMVSLMQPQRLALLEYNQQIIQMVTSNKLFMQTAITEKVADFHLDIR